MDINELRQERARLLEEMRALNDSGLDTAEKREQYARMDKDFEELTRSIQLAERERDLSQSQGLIAGKPPVSDNHQEIRDKVPKNDDSITFWLPGTYRAPNWSDT